MTESKLYIKFNCSRRDTYESKVEEDKPGSCRGPAHLKGFAEGLDLSQLEITTKIGGFLDRISEWDEFVFDGDILEEESFTFIVPIICARKYHTIRVHANLFAHHEASFLSKWGNVICEVSTVVDTDGMEKFGISLRDLATVTEDIREVQLTYSIVDAKHLADSKSFTGCAYSDLGIHGIKMSKSTITFCVGGGRTTFKEYERSKAELKHSHSWVCWDVPAADIRKKGCTRVSPLVQMEDVQII